MLFSLRICSRILNNISKPIKGKQQYRNMSAGVEASLLPGEEKVDNVDEQICNKRRLEDDSDKDIANTENNCAKIQKTEAVQRIKRKNYALMFGYLGRDYFGMQRNPGMKTVEEDLIEALFKAGLINQEAFDCVQTINFQRAARTDKGVSAARQIVSLKLPETANKEIINQYLPNEIRVFGLKKVTKGFNSKNKCSGRTYSYTLPTYAFAPEDVSLLKSEEEIDEEQRLKDLSLIDGKPFHEYRMPKETLERVQAVLKLFEGTHNFHNFTSKVKPLDPRAKRYIMQFKCTEVFTVDNMEFAVLEVKGQSFMLHQIRKMVAVAIAMVRNIMTEADLETAYKMEKLDIPIAPSLGLVLNHVHYDFYNEKFGSDGIHDTLEWQDVEEEVQKFIKAYIFKHIVETEISEKTMLHWLATLVRHSFSYREVVAS